MRAQARRGCFGLGCSGVATMLLATGPAWSSNGLNLIGFGAESVGMGSADIAVARDSAAVNINPAGLTQLRQQRFDGSLLPFWTFGFSHEDAYNQDQASDNPFGVLLSSSYARQALHPDLTFGIGLFVAGGTGVVYENLNTAFGTRDEYSAIVGANKLATGVGWRVNEQLSLGLGLNLTYTQARQKVFPDTSDADAGFFGLRLDGTDGFSFNGRLGLQYRPVPTLTLALSYASETELKLEGGTATINYSDIGLGRVKYRDARVEGFALAQEVGAGAAWQLSPRWLVAGEVTWLDWSGALGDARFLATHPDDPAAPAVIDLRQPLNHRDQYVFAFGIEYAWDDKTRLRGGLNIARNPIPSQTLTPVLNLTADGELDLGFSRKLARGWELAAALQYQPYKSESYDNPGQPFGPASEDYGVAAITVQLGRSW